MSRRISIICFIVLAFSMCEDAFGDFSSAGASFLMIYPGARQVGMAGAFCGLADDAMATYYNPAGLAFQSTIEVNLEFSRWLECFYPDWYRTYGSATVPLGRRLAIAPAVTYLNNGETEATDPYGTPIARWRTWDLSTGLYCGVRISDCIGIGVGVKYIHSYHTPGWLVEQLFHTRGGGTGKSFAVDTGILGRFCMPNRLGRIGLGMAIQNIGPSISYIEGGASDPLPRAIRMGASYKLTLRNIAEGLGVPLGCPASLSDWMWDWFMDQSRICVAVDHCSPLGDIFGESWRSVGFELAPLAIFAFRFGHFEDIASHRVEWTWGYGFDLKSIRFDAGNDSGIYGFNTNNWRYTLSVNIGG